jgi:predicted transposase/invertase (TIGR01784 family)
MIFLNPRSDIAFKKLFGDATHKNVLISFLNCVLAQTRKEAIVNVIINDPHNFPLSRGFKESIVDLRCTDESGNQYC